MNENTTSECLFFRAYRSFLLQDTDFKMNFEMLAYQYYHYPDSFKKFSRNEVQKLIQMQGAFRTGVFNLFQGTPLDLSSMILPKMNNINQPHQDLISEVYQNKVLDPYIGTEADVCLEYPVIYGNIDLMAISNQCAFVVEFKTDTASHAIIGQVIKYYIGLSLKLNLRFYNDVKIITICPGYDPIALKGLKQIGTTTLLVDSKTLKVSEI